MLKLVTSDSFERNNYYDGQVLTASDFSNEQKYHNAKRKLLNRCLHGSRIACGLNVRLIEDVAILEEGMALDCCGREIFVPDSIKVEIPEFDDSCYLLLQYSEREGKPFPIPNPGTTSDDQGLQYTRTIECFRICWGHENPIARHERRDTHWVCCEQDHPIPLARLMVRRDSPIIDERFFDAIREHSS